MINVFDKLKELNFPFGEYVVAGGAMAAHGIREAHDLDIIVTPKLYQFLLNQGYVKCLCKQCIQTNRIMLKGKDVDILPNYIFGKYIGDTDDLIKNADVINGYPFIKLTEFIKFKRELGRPKDLADIELVERYLKTDKNGIT